MKQKGITLISLVITIIILLILAGITISTLTGDSGLFVKTKQSKTTQIKAQIKEELVLRIQDLQVEKTGSATIEDITQEWVNNKLSEYECTLTEDITTNSKIIIIKKSGIEVKYKITSTLDVKEIEFTNQEIPDVSQVLLDDNVLELFNSAEYKLNLTNLLSNTEIMEEILNDNNAREYIIESQEIFNLAKGNRNILSNLRSNSNMVDNMIQDTKWNSMMTAFSDNLTQNIININPSYTYSNYSVNYAFDGKWDDPNHVWSATYGSGNKKQYVICEFDKEIILNQVKIKPGTINSEYVKEFSIYGSNNGQDFSDLIYSGEHGDNNEFETFNFENNKRYKYIKLQIESGHHDNVSFHEIIYGGYVVLENENVEEVQDNKDYYSVVNEILDVSNYDLSLEKVLENEEIMVDLIENENTRTYIIQNEEILNLAKGNNDILNNLCSNSNMFDKMLQDSNWNSMVSFSDNLTQYITNINPSYTYLDYSVNYAFDGKWDDPNHVWSATYNSGNIRQYIICEFDRGIILNQVKIKPGTINSEYVKEFSIYGSNDGQDFSNLIYSGEHGNNNEFETFYFENNNRYKYIKLQIESGHHSNVSFHEIIYGGYY